MLELEEFVWLLGALAAQADPYLPISPYISPSPYIPPYLPSSPDISRHLAAQAEKAHADKAGGGGRERSLKSVEELKADRLREEQQASLQQRASTLRLKVASS